MLTQTHLPSKWSVAIVFTIIGLLIAGVFAWAFFLNRGTLVVRADQPFTLTGAGQQLECPAQECQLSLSPRSYDFTLDAEGYYPQSVTIEVERWQEGEHSASFQIIPVLRDISIEDLPSAEPIAKLVQNGGKQDLVMGGKTITTFATLAKPQLSAGGRTAVVIDKGSAFFVDVETGRKNKRFGDEVQINAALVSDPGERTLLFADLEGEAMLWVWNNASSELTTLSWAEPISRVQWDVGVDHRLFVITDLLKDDSEQSLLDQFIESANQEEIAQPKLFQVNLDTGKTTELDQFGDRVPERLFRRGSRFFVQYDDESVQELVVE